MTTDTATPVADTPPAPPEDFTITRRTVERIETLTKRVEGLKADMDHKKEAAKWATKSYDEARNILEKAVADMLAELHGDETMPLFAGRGMSEAVDAAVTDPVVSGLVERMLRHNITHVNALIVAGYDEAQRQELAAYLTAIEQRKEAEAARAAAEAEGKTEDLPEVPEEPVAPAFLTPQANLPAIVETLRQYSVEVTEAGLIEMFSASELHLLDQWSSEVAAITAEKGDALVAADLPEPPVALVKFGEQAGVRTEDAPQEDTGGADEPADLELEPEPEAQEGDDQH